MFCLEGGSCLPSPLLHSHLERKFMNDYIAKFHEKLIGHFESKAEEFTKRSTDNPAIATVATEIAGLYQDLAKVMRA